MGEKARHGFSPMRYRLNVALILWNDQGEILLGERRDVAGSWQFPQGGAKAGETLEGALRREAEEEIGLREETFEILQSHGPYRYLFPRRMKKRGFVGQEQTYFLARLRPGCHLPEGPIKSPEFRQVRWIAPRQFELQWVADFKREVYRSVFQEILGVELALPAGELSCNVLNGRS